MASSTSHLSRYQPAVLTIAAAAAGYGIYLLYTSSPGASRTSLQRSNAVHRPRRQRVASNIDHVNSTPDSPLGTIVIRRGERSHRINLATDRLPTVEELQHLPIFTSSDDFEDIRHQLEDAALSIVLVACLIASQRPENWRLVESHGFRDLLLAMQDHDEDRVRNHSQDIPRLLRLDGIDPSRVDSAVRNFLVSSKWYESSDMASEDDIHATNTEDTDPYRHDKEPGQGLRGLLYYIAEEENKRKAYEHRGITCEECGEQPIRGIRWHCLNCPDFDLCSSCEMGTLHPKTHVFAKVKIPMPILSQPTHEHPLWYPGDPYKIHSPLDTALKKRLCQDHGFEESQMDAFYDQFVCIANIPNPVEYSSVEAAIDRRAFNKAMTRENWPRRFAANAMFDRIFYFYDTDGNGIIDFEEFVSGLAYLRGPKRYASLERTISGYDMDGDGFVERSDVLRLLRAKFDVQKQIVNDMIEGQEAEQSSGALEVLRSSQPISSIFAQEDIPPGERRWPTGKIRDSHGDMQPLDGTKTLLDDGDPWPRPRARRRSNSGQREADQLRRHLSRFDELLHPDATRPNANLPMDYRPTILYDSDVLDTMDMGMDLQATVGMRERDEELDQATQDPHVQDLLWEITQKGLNQLLDAIFAEKEQQDMEAKNTYAERIKWRAEIDAEKKANEERIEAAASDPLMATAFAAYQSVPGMPAASSPLMYRGLAAYKSVPSVPAEPATPPRQGVSFDITRTDSQSLEELEHELHRLSLSELLDATGYGVRDVDEQFGADDSALRAAYTGSSTNIWNGRPIESAGSRLRTAISSDDLPDPADPTLPQNRPDESSPKKQPPLRRSRGKSIAAETGAARGSAAPPSKARLHYLAKMDAYEREMKIRGGPGRLSYDEVEELAVEDGRGEIRGLVKAWLEWASF